MRKPQTNSLKISLGATWVDHAVRTLIGIFLMPFVLGSLGESHYGTWIFLNSAAGYSGLLYLGFGQTSCRYFSACHARGDWGGLNQVFNVILAVFISMGALVMMIAGCLAWLAPWLCDWGGVSLAEIRIAILLLGANFGVGLAGSVFGGLLTGIQRFDIERGICTFSAIVRVVLTVVLLQVEWGLVILSAIFLVVTCVEVIGHMVFAFWKVETLSLGVRHFRWPVLKECAHFSSYAFLDVISHQVMRLTDTVIIGLAFGARATVGYYIALRLSQFIAHPIQQIGHVLMPRAGELNENARPEQIRQEVSRATGLAFLLVAASFVGAGFFGRDLVTTWIGGGYEQSQLLLMILLSAQLVATPVMVIRSALLGMGHVRAPALIIFVETIANVALSLVLMQYFGLIGVALGTLIPVVIVELGILLPYAFRTLQMSWTSFVRDVLGPQCIPLLAVLAYSGFVSANFTSTTGWGPLLGVALGGGAVLAAGWFASQHAVRVARTWRTTASQVGTR